MAIDARTSGQRILQAQWAQVVNSGTSSTTTLSEPSAGFHAMVDGNITVRFAGDDADRTFPVVQGQYYPYSVISAPASNAVAFMAVFNTVKG